MPEFGTYADAVVHTLRTRAVQSAILIDDSFPTYQDLLDPDRDGASITEAFPDAAAALHLYKTLHEARIVCDVENRIDEIDEAFIEKIRKSDLVVLDWNLRRGSEDSEAAVRVLKGLSASPHFNLVVVYTRANDLTAVWTRAAVRLRGGWQQKERFLDGVDLGEEVDADEVFDEIDPDGRVLEVSDAMIRGYVAKGMRGVTDLKALLDKFESLRVPKQHRARFAEALIHRAAIRRHDAEVDTPQTIVEGDSASDDRYLVCGSVFVSFLQKSLREEQQEERSIFDCLDRALISWRPNLLQLLVSELQNELEQNSYAFNEILVPSKELKAGWIFHTLKEYAGGGEVELRNLVASLNERLVESLERSVWASMVDDTSPLLNFGRQAALLSLADLENSKGQDDKALIAIAMQAAAVEGNDQASRAVMHALNEYLSSDLFRGGHATTGTVFCKPDKSAWYVCVSPACDMVPRPSKDPDSWQASLHPLQPMNMLRLSKCKPDAALAEAERGVQIFVTVAGERIYLKAVHNITRMPRPMTCLVARISTKGDEPWQTHGFTVHLFDKTEAGARIADETLYAVAQLRPAYGARFLHLSGSHQSRVGVDFVRYGTATEDDAA